MYRFFKILIMMLSLVLVFTTVLAVKNSNSSKSAKNDELAVTKPAVPEADILAEYDGGIITKQDLDDRISKIPPQAQGRYKTVDGQSQILDMMVVEDVFYQKAKEMNLLNDPTVLDKINAARKQVLIQEFYKRNVNDQVKLTEAEKQDYYEQNKKDFFVQPNITILYIQAEDEAAANKAMNELKKGTPFIDVSNKYSQNSYAKSINGKIKNIRLNGYIPGIGNDAELEEIIKNSPVDTLNYIGPN
jgi:hypothetical protein